MVFALEWQTVGKKMKQVLVIRQRARGSYNGCALSLRRIRTFLCLEIKRKLTHCYFLNIC